MKQGLSHYDSAGRVRMVDVTAKSATERTAVARGFVKIGKAALGKVRQMKTPKGNPLEIARIAGIAAAKRTAELIPLCHPLLLTHIDVATELCQNGVEIVSRVTTTGPTGVEMEALTATAVAALTIYDMCKALDRGMEILGIYLVEKSGGRSGHYVRRRSVHARR
ncbi:MAG TPA: cyclic pyranopterin monophosphate synthase MoaC [Candidatus Acidoferrales bacterium]|nr:cyclic pyranopterin monophosphate synthase MoaC [Candidatus Acidoferrales bacterium]